MKKIISFLLSAVILFSLVPSGAFAYGKTDKKTCVIDRSGNVSDTDIPSEIISTADIFKGWSSVRGKKTYSLDGYTYIYEMPTVFHRRAELTISNTVTSKTVYNSDNFNDK